ncbi:hypothetical protein HYV85_02385 [Candidatus Woesearchaeota archaeon]|nr:hypothetical protein [Candidatus Woesearchaeota archaeon]
MADKAKGYGSVKRFGVRYGTKLKGKIGKIEAERRLSTKCPYCHYGKAKRVAVGIWFCQKCKSKFTGKAYAIGGPVVIKEEVTEATAATAESAEMPEEEPLEEAESEEQEAV